MSIKQKLYGIWYTAVVGYTSIAWIVTLTAYTGIVFLVVKEIFPSTVNLGTELSVIIPISAFICFYLMGLLALRYNFYMEGQAFGGRKNPLRLNWEMEYIKAKMDTQIGRALVAFHKGEKYDTSLLEASIKEFDDFKPSMEELLR